MVKEISYQTWDLDLNPLGRKLVLTGCSMNLDYGNKDVVDITHNPVQ